jgi:hypothetical protein
MRINVTLFDLPVAEPLLIVLADISIHVTTSISSLLAVSSAVGHLGSSSAILAALKFRTSCIK